MNWRTSVLAIPRGNPGNLRTIEAMSALAQRASIDPVVVQAAQDAVRTAPERTPDADFAAILGDVRRRMRYTHDPLGAEVVKDPRYVIDRTNADSLPEPMDCDDASTLAGAMLGAIGYPTKFVTIATDGTRPREWSHVYVSALHPSGRWVALDPIVREYKAGDEVPDAHLTAPRAYHEGVDPMLRGIGCEIRTTGISGPTGLGYSGRGMGRTLEQMRADAESYGGIPSGSYGGEGSSGGDDWFGQTLSTVSSAFADRTKQAQARAAADIASANARIAKFNRPKEGFLTNADGSTKWANVAIVGVAALALGVVVFKASARR